VKSTLQIAIGISMSVLWVWNPRRL